jgi:hypothetical protein
MKLIRCTIWVLSTLLLIVSIDAAPDPPAVNPHTTEVKAPCLTECPDSLCPLTISNFCSGACSNPSPRSIARARDCKPNRPSDWIVLTGQAADPSPPAL